MADEPASEIEARYGFETYKNYLASASYLFNLLYPRYEDIAAALKPVRANRTADVARIRGLLFNSWNSEVLFNLPRFIEGDLVKFANHWSPVQSYYSIYLALRALIVAKNINAQGDHTTTLRVCSANLIQTEKLLPSPWNILAGSNGVENLPGECSIVDVNTQENPYYFRNDRDRLFSSLCMFLRTTRARMVEDKKDDWRQRNPTKDGPRTRLPAGMPEKLDQQTRPVSLFDCFYRLRTRSNYRDADIFILGSDEETARRYLDALCNVTDKTLFVIEGYIERLIGLDSFIDLARQYRHSQRLEPVTAGEAGIARRRPGTL